MRRKLYLETTIPSYLASRQNRDLVIAGHQQTTREWWDKRRNDFDLYISQFVLDEAKAGDSDASRARLLVLKGLPLLEITPEVLTLASSLISSRLIPKRAATDAAHIAIAAAHRMDFLMTWNCTHIANAIISRAVADICRGHGFVSPTICTPEELLGE